MQARRTAATVAATVVVAAGMAAPGAASTAAPKPKPRADLVAQQVGTPPASVKGGGSFGLKAVVANKGRVAAKASSLRFYLSQDRAAGAGDVVGATAAVKKTPAGKRKSVTGTVTVPTDASGKYWVIACADAGKKIKERRETNNCRVSRTQVAVDPAAQAGLHATLTGTLTFLDEGQVSEPDFGHTKTWHRTGSATINIAINGDPLDPNLVFDATGSTYTRTGSTVDVKEDATCVSRSERAESASGPLKYAGDPLHDEIFGGFTKTDLSGVNIGLFMRAPWTQTDTRTGRGDVPCDSSSKTSTGAGTAVSDIDLVATSATAQEIHYRVESWKAEMNTPSEWDKVEGELVLTRH